MKNSLNLALTFLLLFCGLLPETNAQSWLWARQSTGGSVVGGLVATDFAGNVYAAGGYYNHGTLAFGSVYLHPALSYLTDNTTVWVKYDSSGNVLWAGATDTGMTYPANIRTDRAGNLIIFGFFKSAIMRIGSFVLTNPLSTSAVCKYYVAKISPTGTVLWAICDGEFFAGVNFAGGNSIGGDLAVDDSGNIYVTTSFLSPTTRVGPYVLTNSGSSDVLVAKYDSSGTVVWAKSFGGTEHEYSYAITVSSDGYVYVAGGFQSPSVTIGPSVLINPWSAITYTTLLRSFIAKFDASSGVALWAEAAGGDAGGYATSLTADKYGDVYMTGLFCDSTITFGTTTLTRQYLPPGTPGVYPWQQYSAIYLVRFSAGDVVTWSRVIESPDHYNVGPYCVTMASCDQVWVSGGWFDSVILDTGVSLPPLVPPSTYHDGFPVFIAGYNISGGMAGYSSIWSPNYYACDMISCDVMGNVFISGYVDSSITIGRDHLLPSVGYANTMYVAKYANAIRIDTISQRMDTTLCNNAGFTIQAPTGYLSYLWNNGSVSDSITVTGPGQYYVSCVNCGQVLFDTFNISISLTDSSHRYIDTTLCNSSGTVTLGSDTGFSTYQWSTGSTTESVSISSNGTYWLRESNGCALRLDTFNITLSPEPEVHLGNDTTLCEGNSLLLHCPEPAGYAYSWSTGSVDTSIVVTTGGSYALTVFDTGCSGTDSIVVKFLPQPAPIVLGPDTVLCDEPNYTIISGNSTTIWNTDHVGPTLTVTYSGLYTATIRNQCGVISDSVRVTFENCVITFPNAFTPNNDGLNDIFKAVGIHLNGFADFSFNIYNRFGQRVFYSDNIEDGWDGTFNGTPQDLGTYFYFVCYTLNGQSHMLKGDLELIR